MAMQILVKESVDLVAIHPVVWVAMEAIKKAKMLSLEKFRAEAEEAVDYLLVQMTT